MNIFMSNYILGQFNYNDTDIYYGFKTDNLKWRSSSFRSNLVFPNFDVSNDIFPNSTDS